MSSHLIPLSEWIQRVREELITAQKNHAQNSHPEIELGLTEVTMEAEVIVESSDSSSVEGKLFVITGELGTSEKRSGSQKVVLKFRQMRSDGKPLVLGNENEGDAFNDT